MAKYTAINKLITSNPGLQVLLGKDRLNVTDKRNIKLLEYITGHSSIDLLNLKLAERKEPIMLNDDIYGGDLTTDNGREGLVMFNHLVNVIADLTTMSLPITLHKPNVAYCEWYVKWLLDKDSMFQSRPDTSLIPSEDKTINKHEAVMEMISIVTDTNVNECVCIWLNSLRETILAEYPSFHTALHKKTPGECLNFLIFSLGTNSVKTYAESIVGNEDKPSKLDTPKYPGISKIIRGTKGLHLLMSKRATLELSEADEEILKRITGADHIGKLEARIQQLKQFEVSTIQAYHEFNLTVPHFLSDDELKVMEHMFEVINDIPDRFLKINLAMGWYFNWILNKPNMFTLVGLTSQTRVIDLFNLSLGRPADDSYYGWGSFVYGAMVGRFSLPSDLMLTDNPELFLVRLGEHVGRNTLNKALPRFPTSSHNSNWSPKSDVREGSPSQFISPEELQERIDNNMNKNVKSELHLSQKHDQDVLAKEIEGLNLKRTSGRDISMNAMDAYRGVNEEMTRLQIPDSWTSFMKSTPYHPGVMNPHVDNRQSKPQQSYNRQTPNAQNGGPGSFARSNENAGKSYGYGVGHEHSQWGGIANPETQQQPNVLTDTVMDVINSEMVLETYLIGLGEALESYSVNILLLTASEYNKVSVVKLDCQGLNEPYVLLVTVYNTTKPIVVTSAVKDITLGKTGMLPKNTYLAGLTRVLELTEYLNVESLYHSVLAKKEAIVNALDTLHDIDSTITKYMS